MRTQLPDPRPPVALVTGSTDGIGRATVACLARDGWSVVVVGRSAEKVARAVGELRASRGEAAAVGLIADLSRMADVRRLAVEATAMLPRIDALVLNANTVTAGRVSTPEGFEANFAVGHLGRALLARLLEPRIAPGGHVLGVVGLNLTRMDWSDLPLANGAPRTALGRWQWTHQVWLRAWNRRLAPRANVYMPGLVRTKILADEPQPMRAVVKIANALFGVPVEKGGEELASVIRTLSAGDLRDRYFSRLTEKGVRALGDKPGDVDEAWEQTERTLAPWLEPIGAG